MSKQRLIDAERLKRHYSWWTGPMELTREELDTIVDMQPDATPAWIPVSERLPPAQLGTDLISRQAAIDALLNAGLINYAATRDGNGMIHAVNVIKALPSAQPEHKTGKWIDAVLPNDSGGLPVQVCDQCNTFFPLAYTGGGHRFCPNCGARMDGE